MGNYSGKEDFIQTNIDRLKSIVDSDFGLLDKLVESEALDVVESSKIRSVGTPFERVEMLLDYVTKKYIHQEFLRALNETGQSHVANFISSNGVYDTEFADDWPLGKREIQFLDRNRSFLIQIIQSEEFVDCLISVKVLNNEHRREIFSTNKRSEALLDIIRRTSAQKYQLFVQALRDSNQSHVANFILANGEHSDEFGEDWPLRKRETDILNVNQKFLVDNIEATELVNQLYSAKALSRRQRDTVLSKSTSYEQNEALLEIIRRTSLQNYRRAVDNLIATKQEHIATVLREGGVVMLVHAELNNYDGNVDEAEDHIVSRLYNAIKTERPDVTDLEIERIIANLGIIAVRKGHSVVLYIYYKTKEEFLLLIEHLKSGNFEHSVEKLFAYLLSVNVKTTIKLDFDFNKCRNYFNIDPSPSIWKTLTSGLQSFRGTLYQAKKKKVPTATLR